MWLKIAQDIMDGGQLTREQALSLLKADDVDCLQIVDAAARLRRKYFGNTVKVNILTNAKRALCAEDCHYCGQSKDAENSEGKHPFVPGDELLEQARAAKAAGAARFCVTMAVRTPSWSVVNQLADSARSIKSELGMEVCASLGLMTGTIGKDKLKFLSENGVDAYNHNLNTHRDIYPSICTTHTYDDRLETIRNAREAGLSVCSGLIVGMGESDEQMVDLAFSLRDEDVESIPVNFLIPVEGTKMGNKGTTDHFTPWKCLKYLSLFRMVHPKAELRASAGREVHIRSLQALALMVANSIFADGYLTQDGQGADKDMAMIADLGLVPVEFNYS